MDNYDYYPVEESPTLYLIGVKRDVSCIKQTLSVYIDRTCFQWKRAGRKMYAKFKHPVIVTYFCNN